MFALITVLMIVGSFIDNLLMGTQAHKGGASWVSVVLALIFLIVGNFIIPIPVLGGLILAFVVLFVAEWIRRKDHKEAWKAALGLATGFSMAALIRFIMGLVMIGLWMIWAWI
jgi:uncharacterized protein YqgC (DUF456 family)